MLAGRFFIVCLLLELYAGAWSNLMHCDIYKSSKKDEMYLYIARPEQADEAQDIDPLAVVPELLRQTLVVQHL